MGPFLDTWEILGMLAGFEEDFLCANLAECTVAYGIIHIASRSQLRSPLFTLNSVSKFENGLKFSTL